MNLNTPLKFLGSEKRREAKKTRSNGCEKSTLYFPVSVKYIKPSSLKEDEILYNPYLILFKYLQKEMGIYFRNSKTIDLFINLTSDSLSILSFSFSFCSNVNSMRIVYIVVEDELDDMVRFKSSVVL